MTTITVDSVVDESRFNRFHLALLIWSSFVVLFDSYDLVAYGSVVPGLIAGWHVTPVSAGLIGSYGFIGMMVGAIVLGVVADRFGRRKVLTFSVIVFSLFMFLEAFAPGPTSFTVFRVIAGFGIGGVMPNVLALLADYIPARLRNTVTGIMLCCFSLGGIIAPMLGITLAPHAGWQSLYWVAIVPIVLLPFMVRYFVDAPTLLIEKGRQAELRAVLAKANPAASLPADAQLATPAPIKQGGFPIVELFRHRRALATVMIVIAFFMCLLMINGLSTWLPTFMVNAGYALATGLLFALIVNVGAIVGTLVLGRLADRFGTKRVLIPMFVMATISLALVGITKDFAWLAVLFFIAGACTQGAQNIAYAFVAQYYPPEIRATGVGFASAIGRIGQIIGPTYGGFLLTIAWAPALNIVAFAVPGLVAALAFAFVSIARATDAPAAATPAEDIAGEVA
jgi:AAHS family benzoate transporter-like MFS transporter